MKQGLTIGDRHSLTYRVPHNKTVRHLFEDATEFADFPEVFATGFMVALMERTCTQALAPFLEDGEGSLGVHIDVSHEAPTPPGFSIEVNVELASIDGRMLEWSVIASDDVEIIGRGRHKRALIDRLRFEERLAKKCRKLPKE
ncbi:thioesterase family protein [Erythrobacter sp. GH1-10]|uniref:thioesterase family protein n=1 Tax=Erythrobacter sp. GH1-10 TaxID=3349334 RepID=UPI003877A0E4